MSPLAITMMLTGVIAAGAVLAMLHTLAVTALREITIHDLKVETHRLRLEYAERLARMRKGLSEKIDSLNEPGAGVDQG